MLAVDQVYLRRACELAARGIGNVSPNPPVGAVLVSATGHLIGEGWHHCRGEAHAEVEALRAAEQAGYASLFAGATLYVSLEPCNHHGRTPPCSEALVAAGIARVVIGAWDPNPRTAGGGVARLHAAGILAEVIDDPWAGELIRCFTVAVRERRPYVTLKLAASLDGRIGPRSGSFWLSGPSAQRFVHDLRSEHDAIMVGAQTLATDNPRLTSRPLRTRRRPCWRVVCCGQSPPAPQAHVLTPLAHAPSLLLVPGAFASAYESLAEQAEIVVIGDRQAKRVDLRGGLAALYEREIASICCEGGPTLASALLAARLVDRIEWLVAPKLWAHANAPSALAGTWEHEFPAFSFEQVIRLGNDVRLTIDLAHTPG